MCSIVSRVGFGNAIQSYQELVNRFAVIRLHCKTIVKEYTQGDGAIAERDGVAIKVCTCSEAFIDKAVFITLAVIQNVLVSPKGQRYVYFPIFRFQGTAMLNGLGY